MKTTSELAAEIVGSNSKNSIDDFEAELARVKAILDAQAAQYREALKVATDALKQVNPSNLWDKARMHYTGDQNLTLLLDWHRELCADYETNIARIAELTSKEKP